jgi:hypothetical protein
VVWSKPAGEQVELVSLLVNDVSVGGEVEVLDANGDGRLELLLQSYVEGDDYTELHELDTDGKHHEVLRTYHGCWESRRRRRRRHSIDARPRTPLARPNLRLDGLRPGRDLQLLHRLAAAQLQLFGLHVDLDQALDDLVETRRRPC